jgi:precorrin-6B methylase 1
VPAIASVRTRSQRVGARRRPTRPRVPRRRLLCNAGPRTITHAQLVASWRRALDAFGEALESDDRYLTPTELKQLERELSADRRWLERFAAIRSFP